MNHKTMSIRELADFIHQANYYVEYSFAADYENQEDAFEGAACIFGITKTRHFNCNLVHIGICDRSFWTIDLEHESELLPGELALFIKSYVLDGKPVPETGRRILINAISEEPITNDITEPEDRPHDPARQIRVIWDVEDVQSVRRDLSDEQALQVLRTAKRRHDANVGINWDVLKIHADELFPKKPNGTQ